MATVTGLTAARMLAVEAATVVDGEYDSIGHLILTRHDGTTFDAGSPVQATTGVKGMIEIATPEETALLSDTSRAVSPGGMAGVVAEINATTSGLDDRIEALETAPPPPDPPIHILTENQFVETDAGTSYPDGVSVMKLTPSSAWSLSYGYGSVITTNAGSNRISQNYYSDAGGSGGSPQSWFRQYSTDSVPAGWTSWVQKQTIYALPAASVTQTTSFANYPKGGSRIYYTSVNSSAWDFSGKAGEVFTFVDGNDFARQTFTRHVGGSGNATEVWTRTANSASGWSPWQKTLYGDNSKLAKKFFMGRSNVTPTASNTPTKVTIGFPAGWFDTQPFVVASAETSVPGTGGVTGVSVNNVDVTGFDIWINRANTTNTYFNWIAIAW